VPQSSGDFIIVDDNGAYGPGIEGYDDYGGYGGSGMNGRSRGPLWVRGEYLLWVVEGFHGPPLVTTSDAGTPQADAGILGLPTTDILFGDRRLADQVRSGVRLSAGGWFNSTETTGLEVSGFWLATDHHNFAASAADTPIIARPFFNVEPGFEGQDAELIAFPGLFNGQIDIQAESTLFGAEALLRHCMSSSCYCRVDGLLGARYARLEERLAISDTRTVIGPGAGVAIGTVFSESDLFESTNQFYGGEVGVASEVRAYGFSVEGTLKLALGVNHSHVRIAGSSTASIPVPGGPPVVVNTPAGLLAQSTNIGVYPHDTFAVIPEVGVTVGYEITPRLRATAGYTFFYWTDTVCPGDQIDTNLNLSQLSPGGLVGIPRPEFRRTIDNVWVQGLNFGLVFDF
jgi:Putative beta barrel porin-7 (BBP7)